jgi:PAS domain S-box-containing protein
MATEPPTILIIDDEISILNSLSSFFEDEDYNVFTAPDGERGLEIFFSEKIDIVLTDLRMPKKDGIEVMKAIHQTRPETPMIVISGAGKKQDIIKALRMGAKDYITKPIDDLDMISHTVGQVLENKRLSDENKLYRQKLEKSENQYRTITENIAEGVFSVDEHENFTYTNHAFCDMLQYSSGEILKKNLKDIVTQDSFDIILQETANRKSGLTGRYEIQMLDKNLGIIHTELTCSPIFKDKKKYSGAIAIVRDITKMIKMKKKFEKFLAAQKAAPKGVLPICANCKDIRVSKGHWMKIEDYFADINFSHGICPECCNRLYPEFDLSELDPEK